MGKVIFHIDVNSAYLSWTAVERLKNGAVEDIREIPAIIGGDQESRHGVVLAKSIPARKYGVRTGEPVVNALRKCPQLKMFPPDHRMYSGYSRQLFELLQTYTPDLEQVSVDECYMNFTGIAHRFPSMLDAAFEIKDAVCQKFGFTVNIGISSVRLLAKMASDFEKPNKVHTLFPEEIQVKMWPMPVSELYMAGKSSVEILRKLDIHTIGDLAQADPDLLEIHLKSHGRMLWEFANGIDNSEVHSSEEDTKGIGNSTTLAKDAVTVGDAKRTLLSLAESVASRLRMAGLKAGMVSVEIKYSTFRKVSHQKQLERASNTDDMIYHTACTLFDELWTGEPVRLLGIRSSKLTDVGEPVQMSIFDLKTEVHPDNMQMDNIKKSDEKHEKLDRALDQIKKKYGENTIKRGSLMEPAVRQEKDR